MIDLKKLSLQKTLFATLLFSSSNLVLADNVSDSINEALQYYDKQQYSNAIESLNYASQLIQQKKAETLTAFLPEPLDGWEAEKATSEAVTANFFGGGLTAKRQYNKDSSQITIQITSDSPLLQSAALLLSTPFFTSLSAAQSEKIAEQKAMITYNDSTHTGELKIIIDNRFFVQINGRKINKDDLKAYAKNIDYKKLSALP